MTKLVRILPVAVAALALIAQPAAAKSKPKAKALTCYAHGAHTRVDTHDVRVFTLRTPGRGTRTYACVYAVNRAKPIAPFGTSIPKVKVAGHFVAFVTSDSISQNYGGIEDESWTEEDVNVFDALQGRQIFASNATIVATDDMHNSFVFDLVLRDTGGVAWVGTHDYNQAGVYKADLLTGFQPVALEQSATAIPGALHLRGNRLGWSTEGQRHTAKLA